jgi:hypothetical protein
VYPIALAVILAEPTLTPATSGGVAGAVCPCSIVTVEGETVILALSEVERVTVTGEGAG